MPFLRRLGKYIFWVLVFRELKYPKTEYYIDFSPVDFGDKIIKKKIYYVSARHCSLHIILFSESTASPGFYSQNGPALEVR